MQPIHGRIAFQSLISIIKISPTAVRRAYSSASARSATDDELQVARTWLAKLHAEAIPLKSIGELSFSRSSGPGGQNVNKYDTLIFLTPRYANLTQRVNSKATLKMPLDALLQHVPAAIHGEIKRSRYVAARSNTIIVQADDSRRQSDNAHSCYKRVYEAIAEAGRHAVPTETSAEQMQHVKDLQVFSPLSPATLPTDRKLIRCQAKVR
jgi:peptidyl-tRNA hydrolase ICT1